MSDPMTNVDIEDVLASIRRLVSEDTRPRAVGADAARPAAPVTVVPAQPDRLVLTPSLRILETDETPDDAPATQAAHAQPDQPAPWQDPDARLADLWPSDAPPPQPAPDPHSQEPQVQDQDGQKPDETALSVAEVASDSTADHVQPDHAAMQADAPPEAAVDGASPDHRDAAGDDVLAWEDHHDDAPYSADHDDRLDAGATDAASDIPAAEYQPELAAAAQGPATDWAGHASDADADGNSLGTGMAGDDTSDDDGADDDAAGNILAEESVIDEAMLRELVADIVRQELMGALGERITRNVRKLVRREIHRALSAQEFD